MKKLNTVSMAIFIFDVLINVLTMWKLLGVILMDFMVQGF